MASIEYRYHRLLFKYGLNFNSLYSSGGKTVAPYDKC